MSAYNAKVIARFEREIATARSRLIDVWKEVEQNPDLAWTLCAVFEGLDGIEQHLECTRDGEEADAEREAAERAELQGMVAATQGRPAP